MIWNNANPDKVDIKAAWIVRMWSDGGGGCVNASVCHHLAGTGYVLQLGPIAPAGHMDRE